MAAEYPSPVPEPQPEVHTPAGIFGDVTPAAVDTSSFYSMPQPTMTSTTPVAAAPLGGGGSAFADLLGDFGGGVQPVHDTTDYSSASPASATEFPSAGYR